MTFMMIFKRYYGEGFDSIFLGVSPWDFHWDFLGDFHWDFLGDFHWDFLGVSPWGISLGYLLGVSPWDLIGGSK